LYTKVTQHLPPHTLRRVIDLQNHIAREAKASSNKAAQILGNGADSSSLEALGLVSGRKLAQASVQGLDQLRKLVLPDALVSVIGGGIKGAVDGSRMLVTGGSSVIATNVNEAEAVQARSTSSYGTAKRRTEDKMRQELDDLLASSCVYCDTAVVSLDRPFLAEGEEEI